MKIGNRLFRLGPDDAIGLAIEIVAAPHEQCLHLAPVRARQARVIRRPCRDETVPAAQPVGQKRDRQRIGFRRVIGIDRIEIAGDEKGRTRGASRQKEPRVPAARKPSQLADGGQASAKRRRDRNGETVRY